MRLEIRDVCFVELGDGKNTSFWFDNWRAMGSLDKIVRLRDIYRSGFDLPDKVANCIVPDGWKWSALLVEKYPILQTVNHQCYKIIKMINFCA